MCTSYPCPRGFYCSPLLLMGVRFSFSSEQVFSNSLVVGRVLPDLTEIAFLLPFLPPPVRSEALKRPIPLPGLESILGAF